MTSGNETPGIGGVPGIPKPVTRAPKAWGGMVKALHRDLPAGLRRSQKARQRLARTLRRRRRV